MEPANHLLLRVGSACGSRGTITCSTTRALGEGALEAHHPQHPQHEGTGGHHLGKPRAAGTHQTELHLFCQHGFWQTCITGGSIAPSGRDSSLSTASTLGPLMIPGLFHLLFDMNLVSLCPYWNLNSAGLVGAGSQAPRDAQATTTLCQHIMCYLMICSNETRRCISAMFPNAVRDAARAHRFQTGTMHRKECPRRAPTPLNSTTGCVSWSAASQLAAVRQHI